MKTQSLNGNWKYRIGKGAEKKIKVPFSTLAVGHSECRRNFKLCKSAKKIFLKFYGITYQAKVYLNGEFLGEMLPYCEYKFEITKIAKAKDNQLLVELEDTSPTFGPTAGWENFGGIIRDVEIEYVGEDYIEDVFFHSNLTNDYHDANFITHTKSNSGKGKFEIELFYDNNLVAKYTQTENETLTKEITNVKLWSPQNPALYTLKVSLLADGEVIDTYSTKVGFREFKCDNHHFLLNGKPIFIKGVCKHEMFGDSGHCPTYKQMLFDMQMIKNAGCNFVRLVHYPHNKKIIEIADKLGLMVSEEPGLWWSDTSNPEVSGGSLEVLRRTILRDRNHPSIVFWLSFNECRFTEKYLVDSANVCREYDPTRLVSGANCMSDEDTLKYFNICKFDFYTMHPYSQTVDRAKEAARVLNDKPLLFTEWGGHFVYDNPKLLKEFLKEMYALYLKPSEEGALAGASFWEWSELNDYNRGGAACIDGNLCEGLVDKYRNPRLIFNAFCEAIKEMDEVKVYDFWCEFNGRVNGENIIDRNAEDMPLNNIVSKINDEELNSPMLLRKRKLEFGPVLKDVKGFLNMPYVLEDEGKLTFNCNFKAKNISLLGLVSIVKGYPLEGEYGEDIAELQICYNDGEVTKFPIKNSVDVTTVFETKLSSKINPVAEKSKRILTFGYNKNFERYVINKQDFKTNPKKTINSITLVSQNNGYSLLVYGITK